MGDKSSDMGGPAFPVFPETTAGRASARRGMTLWDYYAAAALACLVDVKFKPDRLGANHASIAAEIADAMLSERRKRMSTPD